MLPYTNYFIVRALHEDRIRDALRPVPEWVAYEAPPQRHSFLAGVRQHVQSSVGRALRRLAASVDPQGSAASGASRI